MELVNTDLPIVYCGVNNDPAIYNFIGSANVAGVFEPVHLVQTVRFLRQLDPSICKIAIVSDPGAMWAQVIENFKEQEKHLPEGVEITGYHVFDTYSEYQQFVLQCQDTVDAFGMLGVFEFAGDDGKNVLLETLLEWTIANSNLPDFAFWTDRVDKGTLCAVTVSGYAQGHEAGKIARGILVEGRSPASYPVATTHTGIAMVNLKRARLLGLNPDSTVLLTAQVVTDIALD